MPSKNKFSKKTYFPTTVFQILIHDAEELNKKLLKAIYAEKERDTKGINRSNMPELGGWHSHNNLFKEEAYSGLVTHLNDATQHMSDEMGYHPDYEMRIGTMWSIINPPGCANRAHVHPGCLWSGVYYIQAPENAGRIEFVEPRTMHLMNQPKYATGKQRPKDCWTKVRFTPTAGKMLIFPSWLYHAVDTNLSKEKGDAGNRIIMSFNLSQHRKKK